MDRLTNMEAFVRVVDAGSFSGAARGWGCSKAAVSKYVAGLEAHLGVELLRRTTRALHLTDAGRSYYARCAALLQEVAALEGDLEAGHRAPQGVLRVTAPPSFVDQYRALVLSDFRARYPGIRMDLHLTHRMVDLVEEGFDVAIRVTAPRDSSLVARRLAPAPLVVVAAPAYLQAAGTPRTAAALKDHACLVDTNFRGGARWRFSRGGKVSQVDVEGPFRVNSPVVVCHLAEAGHGVAIVPEYVASEALADGRLVEVPVGKPAFSWSMYAVYPRRRFVSGRVRAFVDHLAAGLAAAGVNRTG
ncbi:MAG: LysR family transcriptional regulator [Myxococcales bacterium]|nr:LysR family transcriptional regulator [Myxococcales bacterium]